MLRLLSMEVVVILLSVIRVQERDRSSLREECWRMVIDVLGVS